MELTRLVLGTVTMEQCLLETSDLAGASADHTTVGRSCSTPHQHPSMLTSRSLEQVTWVLTLTWDWSTTDQMLTTHMTWTRRHQLRVNIVRSQTHRELVWNLKHEHVVEYKNYLLTFSIRSIFNKMNFEDSNIYIGNISHSNIIISTRNPCC